MISRYVCSLVIKLNTVYRVTGRGDRNFNKVFRGVQSVAARPLWRQEPLRRARVARMVKRSTIMSVGSITSLASSTTTAKGSAARSASSLRAAPTTVAPMMRDFLKAAADSFYTSASVGIIFEDALAVVLPQWNARADCNQRKTNTNR